MKLRMVAIISTTVSIILFALPAILYNRMPRDPIEPEKISYGTAFLFAWIILGGCITSSVVLITAIIGWVKRDRVTVAIALPLPCLVIVCIGILWLEGM